MKWGDKKRETGKKENVREKRNKTKLKMKAVGLREMGIKIKDKDNIERYRKINLL